jgi:beta-phosphoglucomutase-like phosphatase (HAD superfamily)
MGIFWSAPEKPQISHVIFDLDDTLIDTQERFFELQTECMRKFDHDFTIEDERRFQGRTAREEIKQLIGLYKLNVTEEEYFKVCLKTG